MSITCPDPVGDVELLAREREFLASEWTWEWALDDGEVRVPEVPAELLAAPVWELEPCGCDCCREDDAPPRVVGVRWAVPGVWDDEPRPDALVVGDAVADLTRRVERLARVRVEELGPGQAMGEVQALLALTQQLRVLLLPRLADVRGRELFALTGHRSTSAWLGASFPDTDLADAALGWELRRFRHLDAAVRTGAVSLAAAGWVRKDVAKLARHLDRPDGLVDGQPAEPVVAALLDNVVTLIARQWLGLADDDPRLAALQQRIDQVTLSGLRGASQAERVEQGCTLLAEHLPLTVLPPALRELRYAVLPNQLEAEHDAAERRRSFRLDHKPGGGYRVHADLTEQAGEALHTILAAEAARDSTNPRDTTAWQQLRDHATRTGLDLTEALARATEPDQPAPDQPAAGTTGTTGNGGDGTGSGDLRGREGTAGGMWDRQAVLPLPDEPARTRSDGSLRRPRTRGERLHDAFTQLLLRYLSSGLGGEHGKVPVQLTEAPQVLCRSYAGCGSRLIAA